MNGNISYDGNSLQTEYIISNVIDHTNIPEKMANLFLVANANKSAIPNIEYPNRIINVSGVLRSGPDLLSGNTVQEALDELIDTFKGYFRGKDKHLDIAYAGTTRRYIATVNSLGIQRTGALTYAPFNIEFVCTEAFGQEITPTTIINEEGYTGGALNVTPTIDGTAPEQLPIFTIKMNTFTGNTDFVQISNDNNEQSIVVFGQGIEAGDEIVIDCDRRLVTINGETVDYNGTFLELEPGANSLTYIDGYTTRSVDIVATYNKRYL